MERQNGKSPISAMSIDVEDWFHVENLKHALERSEWDHYERRVEHNAGRMLDLLEAQKARCTFFVLGWVAEKSPQLVREIVDRGHEVASHGYGHELIYALGEDDFRRDVERSKKLLEDLTGLPVHGYRAPAFSITDWAVPILQELGFRYDSSVFPTVAHDRYGRLTRIDVSEPILELRPGFAEICISCLRLGSKGIPWGGGGYFRLLPYALFRRGIRHILRSGRPYVFYTHPWEIDPDLPRVPGLPTLNRFRHYVNLERTAGRFEALLADFHWSTMSELLDAWQQERSS